MMRQFEIHPGELKTFLKTGTDINVTIFQEILKRYNKRLKENGKTVKF